MQSRLYEWRRKKKWIKTIAFTDDLFPTLFLIGPLLMKKKKNESERKKKRASKDGASNHRRRASFFTQPRLRSSKFAFYHLDSVDSQANRRTNKSEKDTLSRGIRVVVKKKKNTFSINKNIETRGCVCVCVGDGFPSFFFFLFFSLFWSLLRWISLARLTNANSGLCARLAFQ